jgi:hypothetical protein
MPVVAALQGNGRQHLVELSFHDREEKTYVLGVLQVHCYTFPSWKAD